MARCRSSALYSVLLLCLFALCASAHVHQFLAEDVGAGDVRAFGTDEASETDNASGTFEDGGWTIVVPMFHPMAWLQQQWTYIDQLTSQLVPKCRYASSLMGWSNDDMLQQLSYQRLQHALAEYADSSKARESDSLPVSLEDAMDVADQHLSQAMSSGMYTVITEYDGETGASHSMMVEEDGRGSTRVTHITTDSRGYTSATEEQQPAKQPCRMHQMMMMMSSDAPQDRAYEEEYYYTNDDEASAQQMSKIPAVPYTENDLQWTLQDVQGNVNWGLVIMLVLCCATAAVMFSFVGTFMQLRKVIAGQQYTALDDDTLHVPLLADENSEWASAKAVPVQYACQHADHNGKTIDISYVVLADK